MCISICIGVFPGYGVLPPELAHDHAAAAAAAAASMTHLAGLGSLSPGGLAYARAAMVCDCFSDSNSSSCNNVTGIDLYLVLTYAVLNTGDLEISKYIL